MENKLSLPKIYSEAEKDRLVQDAINDIYGSIFKKFEEHVESLITGRLLAFCDAHPAITSMDTQKLPIADCTP
ncbi:MAG: hypothetical protein JNK42_00640 [Caedimonas sp.]|nr:hypothetical protein [Caedimonas sp.]